MNPYREVDMKTWERRSTFAYFREFANPCMNVTVPLDARRLYQCAKETKQSFFLLCLYSILRASNEVPQVRQRIHGDTVVEFERIAAMTPIMTAQDTFCQIWCEYAPTFAQFAELTIPLVTAGKQGCSNLSENHSDDYICASVNPWFHFSAGTQPELFFGQTTPILAWGKMVDGIIPVAGKFHHGLMEGVHIGRFFSSIETSFANPDSLGLERFSLETLGSE